MIAGKNTAKKLLADVNGLLDDSSEDEELESSNEVLSEF